MRRIEIGLALLLGAALGVPGDAQTRGPGSMRVRAGHGPTVITVLPGDTRIDAGRITPGEWGGRVLRVADGTETEIARMHYSITQAAEGMQFTQTMDGSNGVRADTSVFHAEGIRPLWHRGHAPGSTLELAFGDAKVTGRQVADSTVVIDETLDGPAFDGTLVELVVGALPLETGLEARMPLYVHSLGRVWLTLTVTNRDAEGWHVDAALNGRATRLRVDPETRRVTYYAVTLPDGSEFRMVRS